MMKVLCIYAYSSEVILNKKGTLFSTVSHCGLTWKKILTAVSLQEHVCDNWWKWSTLFIVMAALLW